MATSTPPAGTKPTPKPTARPEGPPEEQFWQRYSPHHEFPLSSVGSVLVYVLAAVLIWAVITLSGIFRAAPPPEVGVISDGSDGTPGAPGNPGAPGDPGPKEAVEPATPDEMKSVSVPPLEDLPKVPIDPNSLIQDFVIDDKALPTPELDKFKDFSKETQRALADGLKKPKSTGGGGDGGDGGGGGTGGTSGSIRVKRMARWSLIFNTHGGDDYLVQLASMGAMVGVPTEDPVQFLIFRNLKAPQGKTEDVRNITQMRWTDDRPDSIGGLCHGLGLPQTPRFIVAFFPETVEKQMKEAEHNYRGLNEDQIAVTRFLVVKRGNGYVPVVMDQQPLAAGRGR